MVNKSLTFIALLLCAILAETVAVKKDNQSKKEDSESESEAEGSDVEEGSESDEDDEGDEGDEESGEDDETEETDSPYPSLSCMIFKDLGCNSECSVLGKAFGLPSSGTCADGEICECEITRDVSSLDTMWKEKFDSSDTLKEIKKNKKLAKKVRSILASPSLLTGYETKQALKSILSDDQYKKLTLKDNSKAAKMIGKDGKLDLTVIKKHVTDEVPKTLKSSDTKKLSALKYKPTLLKALKKTKDDSEDDFSNLASDIRRTKNKSLGDVLGEYLKKNSIDEPAKDKDTSTVADTIAYYVVDELINKADNESATDAKGKKASAKKAPTKGKSQSKKEKPVSKKNSKKSKAEDDADDDKKTVSKKPKKKSKVEDDDNDNDADDASLSKNRFTLPGFNKSVLYQSGPINQRWSKNGWTVRYQRDWATNVTVEWTKGSDSVTIQKYASSAVEQNWTFGNVQIHISKQPSSQINENWNFGKASYKYSKEPAGYVSSNWSTGKADKKMLAKYQRLIDAWCAENSFLISMGSCVVYGSRAY